MGLLGPKIYPLMGTANFRDITSGNNGDYSAGVGYDLVTGMGVPNVAKLMATLGGAAAIVAPDAPTGVSAAAGEGQATVSFTAPANTGGAAILYYTVTSSPGGFTVSGTSSPIVVSGLTDGTSYTFTVTATNAAGTGSASAASTAVSFGTLSEFTDASINGPVGIVTGPDGALWFTNFGGNSIGRMDAGTHAVTHYTAASVSGPERIALGADGGLWFTNSLGNSIGRIDPTTHAITNYTGTGVSAPEGITAGPDGQLWFSNYGGNLLGFVNPATGAVSGYTSSAFTTMKDITTGPDGTLWFTNFSGNIIGEFSQTALTINQLSNANVNNPWGLVTGPDGALWFTNNQSNSIGRLDPVASTIAKYTDPSIHAPQGITVGPDGALWFTNNGGNSIGRIDPVTKTVTTYSDGNESGPKGITPGPDGALWYTNSVGNSIGQVVLGSTGATPVAPGAPTIIGAHAGIAQAVVMFKPSASDGGAAITHYTVTSIPGGLTATGTESPITINGLIGETSYTFKVTATNSAGTGAASALSTAVTPIGPPTPPTGILVTVANGQATISFTPPTNNGGDAVTSYTVTSSPGGLTATGTTSPLTITGLTDGVSYTFTVTATSLLGTSPVSVASMPATPTGVPGAPTGVTATPGNGQATINFTPPANTGGLAITVYKVTSNPGSFTGAASAGPINVTGLTNGVSYTFTVTAANSAGVGPASVASVAVTPVGQPGAPTGVTATAGVGQATVTFTAPTNNGGAAITGYTVTSSPGGLTATGTTSPIIITGLTGGVNYTFTVKATNGALTSAASAASAAVEATGVPGAPTNVVAIPGSRAVSVRFSAPLNNGGSAITSYTVTSSPGNLTGTGTSSPIGVSGLVNGGNYTFTVTATNAIGTSAASAPSATVTPAAQPGAPTGVTAVAGPGQATVTFAPPTDTGGVAITSYTVTSSNGGFTATGTGSPITITGLVNGTNYTFTVVATNSAGSSGASTASVAVTPAAAPNAPVNVGATPGSGQVTLNFLLPANNGAVITSYTATSSPGNITGTAHSLPVTVTGLTNGTSYTFTVTATNAAGTSAASAASAAVTPRGVPGAPTGVSAVAGPGQATISFTAPANNNGAAVNRYEIISNPGNVTAFVTSSPYTMTGLTAGTNYTFTVAASNAAGFGPASVASAPVAPTGPPGAPTGVTALAGNGQATVSFTAPTSTGGLAITSYTVTSSPGNLTATGNTSPIIITGLTGGINYTFTVTASNGVSNSTASAASAAVTPAGPPGAPTGVNAVAGNGQATVTFTAPTNNGGTAITGYTVTSSPGNLTSSGNLSPIVIGGLINGTSYTFTVTATNGVATSSASAASTAVTPAGTPGAPTGVTAVAGGGQATVTFTAPANNGGAGITSYTVTSSPGNITATGNSSPITVTGLTIGTSYSFSVTGS